ncbi:glycosyltransferase family 2 protein [Salegentibacter mishustinae]|uniref:glycosyltransferase family 2 protein n=1 Tax=Salegentibacter mishustinae TaxID=270918 RepID=UPI002490F411|nr:glycosyltransferase family 2 protein [Salegentibacter mishustinae]
MSRLIPIFKSNNLLIVSVILISALLILAPKILLGFLKFNLFVISLHGSLQLWWALKKEKTTKKSSSSIASLESNKLYGKDEPDNDSSKISIHIPAYNEPSDILIATIQSCLNIDYPNFEIIVLDNNTPNQETWLPVRDFCSDKKNVFFYHIDNLEGYKAGALDVCMELTNPDSKYIFIVDADYRVSANCLKTAVEIAENQNADLVQFPQDYHSNGKNSALIEEYAHYFRVFAKGGNYNNSVLATGTLSFYKRESLEKVGGWKCNSITEDAEMGLKFQEKQLKSVFCEKTIGKGLLPFSIRDLKIQRERWVYGNMQCIGKLLKSSEISFWRKLSLMVQLTSWVNFLNFSLLAAILSIMLFPLIPAIYFKQALTITASSLWVFISFKFILFGISTKFKPKLHLKTWLINLVFTGLNTFCWMGVLQGKAKPFERTSKFLINSNKNLQYSIVSLGLFAVSTLLSFTEDFFLAGLFLFPAIFICSGQIILKQQLSTQNTPVSNLKEVNL